MGIHSFNGKPKATARGRNTDAFGLPLNNVGSKKRDVVQIEETPMTKKQSKRISRRTILQGAGAAMALPWLESIPVWGTEISVAGETPITPKRFAALFMACGVNPNHWWAKGSGADMELGKSLQPMEDLKTKMNYVEGLFNNCLLYTSPSPRDLSTSRMPSSA